MTIIICSAISLIAFIVGIMVGFSFVDERTREKNFEMKKLSYQDIKTLHVLVDAIRHEIHFNHLELIEKFINQYQELVKRVYKNY